MITNSKALSDLLRVTGFLRDRIGTVSQAVGVSAISQCSLDFLDSFRAEKASASRAGCSHGAW